MHHGVVAAQADVKEAAAADGGSKAKSGKIRSAPLKAHACREPVSSPREMARDDPR